MTRYYVMLSIMMAVPASAQTMDQPAPVAQCPQLLPPPPEMASWAHPVSVDAAKDARGLAAAGISVDQAVRATLKGTGDIQYITRPEKPGGSVSYGGMFGFVVKEAGTYRVALGSGAWIDILRGKKAIASAGHGHGPACSGIRKMVDFALKPGRYTLQIAANGDATLPLLVARAR
ncbi:MAG TPA: homogentisate 1,2-dioxygenase [Sphingobium sp.]